MGIVDKKRNILTNQLNILQNEYLPLLANNKQKYETYSNQQKDTNLNILSMVDNALSFKSIPTMIMATKPNIQFNTNNAIQKLNTFMEMYLSKVDDCDRPYPCDIQIRAVESDSISIQYDIKKKYYKKIGKPVLKLVIEYALIKNDEFVWNDYKEQSEESEDEKISASDTESDESSDYQKKEKKTKPKIRIMNALSIPDFEQLKWRSIEIETDTKKNKKYFKKYKIEEKIKNNKTYIVRMKLLNESGYSQYPKTFNVVQTSKEKADPKVRGICVKDSMYKVSNFTISKKGKTIRGKQACSGHVMYAEDVYKGKGYQKGLHFWSVKAISTNSCYRSIGILAGKRDKALCEVDSTFWPTSSKNYRFDGYHDGWNNGQVLTVKMDLNKWRVVFFIDNIKRSELKLEKNRSYHFVACLCSASANHYECVPTSKKLTK